MTQLLFITLLWLILPGLTSAQDAVAHFESIQIIKRQDQNWSPSPPEYFSFSPDGEWFTTASESNTAAVWSVQTGEMVLTLTGHGAPVEMTAWSPDGQWIATNSEDGTVRIWDASTGENLQTIKGYSGIAWSPDSQSLAVIDGIALHIWDVETQTETAVSDDTWGIVYQVAWSPDGSHIATAGGWTNNYLHIWSTDGERLDTFWAAGSVSWSPDGSLIASEGQIRSLETGLPTIVIPEMTGEIAWHPSGKWIAAFRDELRLWNAVTGEAVEGDFNTDDCAISNLVWSTDGSKLATDCLRPGGASNDIVIWEFHS
ncbi:MAG: hypothetical protein K8L97_03375 [Anaerolineae bacterium]|nr:hypothetical protein [Anaerolineae bacterium]